LRRKNAVSDIWATWCGCSVSELGSFARFQHLHPELKLLLVARDSTVPEIKKVFRAQGISGYGKDAERKSQTTDFPSPLGNPAHPARFPLSPQPRPLPESVEIQIFHQLPKRGHFFYEKVIKVKADAAALLMFELRPTASSLLSVFQ
jgi:hypothetical protein